MEEHFGVTWMIRDLLGSKKHQSSQKADKARVKFNNHSKNDKERLKNSAEDEVQGPSRSEAVGIKEFS